MIRRLLRTARTLALLVEAELLGRRARLSRRVDELERRLDAALASIEREAAGVDVDAEACAEREHGDEHHRCGACTYNAIRGAEAEELRTGIERILEDTNHVDPASAMRRALVALLDRVNARDNLAYVTERDRTELSDAERTTTARNEAARRLLDALAMPSGRSVRAAWEKMCLLHGRFGNVMMRSAFEQYPAPTRSTARIRIAVDYAVMATHVRSRISLAPDAHLPIASPSASAGRPLRPSADPSAVVALCPVSSSSGTAVPSQRDGGTYPHGAS